MESTPSGSPIDRNVIATERVKSGARRDGPARLASSAIIIAAPGSRSEGLIINELPVGIQRCMSNQARREGDIFPGIPTSSDSNHGPKRDHGFIKKIFSLRDCGWKRQAARTGEVEGTNGSTDTERGLSDLGIHITSNLDLVGEKQARQAAHGLDDLETAEDVALCVAKRLSLLEDDRLGNVVHVVPEQSLQPTRASRSV
jgi:hypothetical protein